MGENINKVLYQTVVKLYLNDCSGVIDKDTYNQNVEMVRRGCNACAVIALVLKPEYRYNIGKETRLVH